MSGYDRLGLVSPGLAMLGHVRPRKEMLWQVNSG